MPQTTIHSNGSKFAGQEPDSIDDLLEVLAAHPLDARRFPRPIRCAVGGSPLVEFHGNFTGLSHVFRIVTDDPVVIGRLAQAVATNLAAQANAAQDEDDDTGWPADFDVSIRPESHTGLWMVSAEMRHNDDESNHQFTNQILEAAVAAGIDVAEHDSEHSRTFFYVRTAGDAGVLAEKMAAIFAATRP